MWIQKDVKHGKYKAFYANKQLKEIGEYKKGEYKILSFYRIDGVELVSEGTGTRVLYENQQPVDSGQFVKGFKEGPWSIYHDNGGLKERENYSDDFKAGRWIRYRKNGNLLYQEENAEKGKLILGTGYDEKGEQHFYSEIIAQPDPQGGFAGFYTELVESLSTLRKPLVAIYKER